MSNIPRRISLISALCLIACSEGGGPVADPGPTAITLQANSSVLAALGGSLTISVVDNAGRTVEPTTLTWRSADPAIVSVDARGVVTAVSEGVALVHANLGNVSGSLQVTVRQSIASLSVPPLDTLTWFGKTVALIPRATDPNGHAIGSSPGYSYTSSDNAVATVSTAGVVTARGNGSAIVTVTAGGKTADVAVSVRQKGSVIQITPAFTKLRLLGDTIRLRAVVQDSGGNVLPVQPAVIWSIEPGLSPIDLGPTGLVRAAMNGEAKPIATAGALTGQAKVLVNTRGAVRVTVRKTGAVLPSRIGLRFDSAGIGETRSVLLARDTVFHGIRPGDNSVLFGFGNAPACIERNSILGRVNVMAADTVAFEVPLRCFSNVIGAGTTFPTDAPFINVLDASDAWGADLRPVSADNMRFLKVHPTEKRILVTDGAAVSVLPLAAGSQKQAIPGVLSTDRNVQWSTDGARIVFLRDGGAVQDVRSVSLMSIRPDGSDLQTLGTFTSVEPVLSVSQGGYAVSTVAPGAGRSGIAVLRTGDTLFRNVPNIEYLDGLALSPDGSRVIYYFASSWDDANMFVANVDGTGILKLNVESFSSSRASAAWSADGKLIAYSVRTPDLTNSRLFLINPDGTNRRPVIELTNNNEHPRFSRDGQFLLWVNSGDVYVAPMDLAWKYVIMPSNEIRSQFYSVADWLN